MSRKKDGRRTADSKLGAVLRENVERLLEWTGMTAAEFRESLGMSRATYSGLFKNQMGPRMETVKRLADALGVEPWRLLVPPPKPPVDWAQRKGEEGRHGKR